MKRGERERGSPHAEVYACLGAALVFGSLRAFQLYQAPET